MLRRSSQLLDTFRRSTTGTDRQRLMQYWASSSAAHQHRYDYDLLVIGGGSGGLACSKAAADLGARVLVVDYVQPTPIGHRWGLGGTCVNVGCVPKKLMHLAALAGETVHDAAAYGWPKSGNDSPKLLDWCVLRQAVQDKIKATNWVYRVQLKTKHVTYMNAFASFIDKHQVQLVDASNQKKIVTADKILLATGTRPRYPTVVGTEFGITSDDLFALEKSPGKTCVIGGSYVGLECAGLLHGIGLDVQLLIRSIPLRGFDQQCAYLLTDHMTAVGVKIHWQCVPKLVEKLADGRRRLVWKDANGTDQSDTFDTVLWAIGREPRLDSMHLSAADIDVDRNSRRVLVDDRDRTSTENVYAIGDIAHDRPELTPTAIAAGQLLARRLFGDSTTLMDYRIVPTTVFTPIEYGSIGLTEQTAIEQFGDDNIEVYHAYYVPYEYQIPNRSSEQCYIKTIARRHTPTTVLGMHYVGPNAGEVMQGYASAMLCGITMDQLQRTIAIHPTSAEQMVQLVTTKRSGVDAHVVGCCG